MSQDPSSMTPKPYTLNHLQSLYAPKYLSHPAQQCSALTACSGLGFSKDGLRPSAQNLGFCVSVHQTSVFGLVIL